MNAVTLNAQGLLRFLSSVRDRLTSLGQGLLRTSGILGLLMTVVVIVCAFIAVSTLGVTARWQSAIREASRNYAPSILLADDLRARLFSAVADSANDLVMPDGDLMDTFGNNKELIVKTLTATAQNLSGQEPAVASLNELSSGVATYEGYLRAASLAGPSKRVTMVIHDAEVMQQEIVPSAEHLGDLKRAQLRKVLAGAPDMGSVFWSVQFGTLLLIMVLVAIQIFLTLRFRRVLNVPLVLAVGVSVALYVVNGNDLSRVRAEVASAVDGHFAALSDASRTKALLYGARADQSFYLISDDKDSMTEQFQKKTKHLFSADVTDPPTLAEIRKSIESHQKVAQQGYLADVINASAGAEDTRLLLSLVADYAHYLEVDAKVRTMDGSDQHKEAIALSTGKNPGELNFFFGRVDEQVGEFMKIHTALYQQAIQSALEMLDATIRRSAFALIAIFFLALIGIRTRIAEFN
jgi:hypothetical protein